MKKKIYFFIGTTAELLKLFPVMREMEGRGVPFKIITSGQTSINFREVWHWIKKTKADINLSGKPNESSLLHFLLWAAKTLTAGPIILREEFVSADKENSFLIVHGDTVSSAIGAVIAKIFGLRLVHIESGLRSFSFLEPFPEELCRVFVSYLADIRFCPNEWSLDNLAGKSGVNINTFQNTWIESFWFALKRKSITKSKPKGKYFILITHRQEHVVFGKTENRKTIDFILKEFNKKMNCLFIAHATTTKFLKKTGLSFSYWQKRRVRFLPRLSYQDFIWLLKNAEFMITDGGGNQEESYYLGLPCLVIRKRTERKEGLESNVILAKGRKKIIKSFLENYNDFRRGLVRPKIKPSKIIVDYLSRLKLETFK